MTERTEQLVAELVRDLTPVRRLPVLWKVAARVTALALLGIAAPKLWAAWSGQGLIKPEVRLCDALAAAAQLAAAAGALALALAACVPGREALGRGGAWVALGGGVLSLAAAAALLASELAEPFSMGLLVGVATCTSYALIPALLPTALLVLFVGRAAPLRPSPALLAGAIAGVSVTAAPVNLSCGEFGALHGLLGHVLAPVTGGVLLFVTARLLYRPSLPLTPTAPRQHPSR